MMGRPPKPKSEVKNAELRIRMTRADRKLLDRAASATDAETSTWARSALLELARQLVPKK